MYIKKSRGPAFVTLPDGTKLTRSELPDKATRRWVASRKAKVVLAVEVGLIQLDEACALYGISVEEFEGWVKAIKKHGVGALKATKLQNYRQL